MPTAPRLIVDLSIHRSSRGGAAVAMVVIHATAGTDSLTWLKQNPRGVSAHVLIRKDGTIIRLVPDSEAAHHAGYSHLVLGQRVISRTSNPSPNQFTLGLELENLNNGHDPYPAAQLSAMGWQLAQWAHAYPQARMAFHREIDTQGKRDPAGLTWPAVYRALAPWFNAPALILPPTGYTAQSRIMAQSAASDEDLIEAFALKCGLEGSPYAREVEDPLRNAIGPAYARTCREAGADLGIVLGQCGHESDWLTSALSQRRDRQSQPLRNPAGIGVTGASSIVPRPGYVWDADRQIYRACTQFVSWEDAIVAHVGRLVAYATEPLTRTFEQALLVAKALGYRGLSITCQGSAPTPYLLGIGPNPVPGCGWAGAKETDGWEYGNRVAAAADALLELT